MPNGKPIAVARSHAEGTGLAIDYRVTTAEDLAAAGERFDAVLALEIVERHTGGQTPFAGRHPLYALVELAGPDRDGTLRPAMESLLESAFEAGVVADAVIAESLDQAGNLWRLREGIPEAQKKAGGSIKHDISVPVSRVPDFLKRAEEAVETAMPGVRTCAKR